MRRVARLAVAGTVLFALTCVAVLFEMDRMLDAHGVERPDERPVKVAIVLASGTRSDGTISHASRERTRRAIALLRARGVERLIFSGSADPRSSRKSTAALMRAYALAAGVPAERIVIEEASRTTFENLRYSLAIAHDMGAAPDARDIAIVTDSTHLTRSWLLASYLGGTRAQLAASDSMSAYVTREQIITVTREAAAWWYNIAKIMAWEGMALFGVPTEIRARIVI